MKKFLLIFLSIFFLFSETVLAQGKQPHYTIILNQVRGDECCDAGNFNFFKAQLAELEYLDLEANFALRFDVLQDGAYLDLVAEYSKQNYGLLLEITPALASMAEVEYKGNKDNWYEAQNVFLIGYNREERQKLIDTYMELFKEKLGEYPEFTSAWMIDNWSLAYLKSEYGVIAHQITREQFGTDSYTLYGGPVHYPYWPSNNWAMMPDGKNLSMPLIMRQTIMDPVFCYGDKTDSYTSQPNDYMLRQDNLNYFRYLFAQAHQQNNDYTFALIGLENSMPEAAQQEYRRQLRLVKNWREENKDNNLPIGIAAFTSWLEAEPVSEITIYAGQAQKDKQEAAWWINTDKYRARLRLSDGVLAVSDLRIYDPNFIDPYSEKAAGSLGWWITPFALDGSRIFAASEDYLSLRNDRLKGRLESYGQPEEIVVKDAIADLIVKKEDSRLAIYDGEEFLLRFVGDKMEFAENINLADEYKKSEAWGFKKVGQKLEPFVKDSDLEAVREELSYLLFPELKIENLDASQSELYINNRFAVAGRNPVRLVFFPRNTEGKSIFLADYPQVELSSEIDQLDLLEQHGSNGMLFIDLQNSEPKKLRVEVTQGNFSQSLNVYFAPNCKVEWQYCLVNPRQATWFLRSFIEDKLRTLNEKMVKKESFVD